MKKEFIEEAVASLVESWKDANEAAWSTVGRGGPVFSAGDLGDWDYIEAAWAAHHAAVEADEVSAREEFWAVLAAAPAWLRMSRPWLEDAWERAFINQKNLTYVGHACMPDVQEVFERLGI